MIHLTKERLYTLKSRARIRQYLPVFLTAQAERLAHNHVQGTVLHLLDAPYVAFHDPLVLFEVDLFPSAEGSQPEAGPPYQRASPATLVPCAPIAQKKYVYRTVAAHRQGDTEFTTPARLAWAHQHSSV